MKLFNLLLILSSLFIIGCGEKEEAKAEEAPAEESAPAEEAAE